MFKAMIIKRFTNWISVGENISITKEPVFLQYRALLANGKLRLTGESYDI